MTGLESASGFLEASVRTATPLALAALGECVSERAGVINIGLEGAIIAGALGATVAAGAAGAGVGFAAGAAAGVAIALLFALFTVWMRADQIITGTAITLFALGLTGTVYRTVYGSGGVALTTPTAVTHALLAFVKAGDHILMPDTAYQPARRFCEGVLKRFGVETTYYDPLIGEGIGRLIKPNTKVVYCASRRVSALMA